MNRLALVVLSSVALAAGTAARAADATQELADKRAAIATMAGSATRADLAVEHYRLGVWARRNGFEDDARAEFRAAIASDPDNEAAHQELGEVRCGSRWLPHEEAMAQKGLVRRNGAWILKEEAALLDLPKEEKARRAQEQKKVSKLLSSYATGDETVRRFATEALAGVEDRYKLDPFAWALRSKSADVRLLAAKELGRLGDRRGLRPLVWRALYDPERSVRLASVAAAKQIGEPNLAIPFIKALGSEGPEIRMHAAEALGETGEAIGVQYLVYHIEAHGGGAPRTYFANVKQVSFIQDFDVEVAQTAFIADPQVGVIQEGIVLDVQVVATSQVFDIVEREVVYASLRKLTGATDVKDDPAAWAAWWKEHGRDLLAKQR